MIFLEYLRITGEVDSIDDDLDAWTKFNSTGKVCLKTSSLVKVSAKEKEQYEAIKKTASEIKYGSTVYLDVGPPNYVRAILEEQKCNVTPEIAEALMKKSKVIGWTDAQHAIIQYDGGKRYKINKKYLTVPDRFDVKFVENDDFNWNTVEKLKNAVFSCVKTIHRNEQNEEQKEDHFSVDVFSMLKGRPPMVEFRIRSTLATGQLDQICKDLEQNHGWKLEKRGTIIDVSSAGATYGQRLTVGFLFNDDVYISSITSGSSACDSVNAGKSERKEYVDLPEKASKPDIQSVDEFEFITLQNKTLKRTVYFPYLVHGPARIAEEPEGITRKKNTPNSLVVQSVKTMHIGGGTGSTNIDTMISNSDVKYC